MRNLLTIIRYEFLMQVKSARFKGMLVLVFFMGLNLYQEGVRNLELSPSRYFLDDDILPFYMAAVVFAGLFSMGRIRKTGMHSILMARPFHTFTLVLGQLVAALLSLLIPLALIFFPAGLLVKWEIEIDYPLEPLFYIILFYFIPAACTILAVTIWVRTCFKNNLMSLVILGFLFAGAAFVGNKEFMNSRSPEGGMVHHFVPLFSYFSEYYWRRIPTLETMSTLPFTQAADWTHFGLSMVFAWVFLLLSCYHLRRTEPQRKVLGSYGRRWFHTPTFLKVACDLKIDPHVTWKSHVALLALVGLLAYKSAWPVARPVWRNYQTARLENPQGGGQPGSGAASPKQRYAKDKIPAMNILPVRVVGDVQILTAKTLESRLTFTCEAEDTSGTVAVIAPWGRWQYVLKEIALEGRPIPFSNVRGRLYMEGEEFEGYCDGKPHVLTIRGSRQGSAMGVDTNPWSNQYPTRGYFFCVEKKMYEARGRKEWNINAEIQYLYPTTLTLTVAADSPLVRAPVEPSEVREETVQAQSASSERQGDSAPDNLPRVDRKLATYVFNVPAERNGRKSNVMFLPLGHRIVDFECPGLEVRFVVEDKYEGTLREILDLGKPVLREFCDLYDITPAEPLLITIAQHSPMINSMRTIRREHARYQREGRIHNHRKKYFYDRLDEFEKELLKEIFWKDFIGWGPETGTLWDLKKFTSENVNRGLNHRLSLSSDFLARSFDPVEKHADAFSASILKNKSRGALLKMGEQLPLFQMLYLVLEHDGWMRMLKELKPMAHAGFVTYEMVQEAAEEAHGESLFWFFDYWCGTGKGYPSYRVDSVSARMYTTMDDETRYEIEAEITNAGTGRMIVPVVLVTSSNAVRDQIWIGAGETVRWKTTSKHLPKSVLVDPRGWILTVPYWDEKSKSWVKEPKMEVKVDRTG